MKCYVVRHKRSTDSTSRAVDYFETKQEALAEFEKLRQTYRRERVWVVDLQNEVVIADSRAK